MSLFTSIFSSEAPQQTPGTKAVIFLMGTGNYEVEIVGEEHYQAALEGICGPRLPKRANRLETAVLIVEDKNAHDKNVVRVEIRGRKVGYLSRETALVVRRQLKERGMPEVDGQCQAVIRGGWLSADGRRGPYCVSLDLPIWFY